jgi:hypothetical protein
MRHCVMWNLLRGVLTSRHGLVMIIPLHSASEFVLDEPADILQAPTLPASIGWLALTAARGHRCLLPSKSTEAFANSSDLLPYIVMNWRITFVGDCRTSHPTLLISYGIRPKPSTSHDRLAAWFHKPNNIPKIVYLSQNAASPLNPRACQCSWMLVAQSSILVIIRT